MDSRPLTKRAEPVVDLDLEAASPSELSERLTAIARRPVSFVPARASELMSLQVKGYPLSEFLALLAKQGAVVMDGQPVKGATSRPAGQDGGERRVSIEARQLDSEALSRMLEGIAGKPVVFRAASPEALFNLQAKDMPVSEILKQMAKMGELAVQEP